MKEAPWRNRWRRYGLVSAAGIAVLALVAALVVNSPPSRRWALQRLVTSLEARGIQAAASELQWSLPSLRFRLLDLSLSAGPAGAPPFLEADELTIDLSLRSLSGDPALQSVELRSARMRFRRDSAGAWNLPDGAAEPDAAPTEPLALPVDRLVVVGLAIELEDALTGMTAGLSGIDAQLGGSGPGIGAQLGVRGPGIDGAITASAGGVDWPENRLPIDSLQVDVRYDGRDVSYENLSVVAPPLRITGSGALQEVFSAAAVDADTRLSGELGALLRLFDVDAPAGGAVRAAARVRGPMTAPAIEWSIESEDLQWRELAGIAVAARGSSLGNDLDVEQLRIELDGASLEGNGSVDSVSGAGALRAEWRDLDLARLSSGFLEGSVTIPGAFSSGDLEARWSAPELDTLVFRATTELRPAGAAEGVVPIGGRAEVRREAADDVRAELTADLEPFGTLGGELRALLPEAVSVAQWRDIGLDASARIETANVGRAVDRLTELGILSPIDDELRPDGSLTASLRFGGTAARPRIDGTLSAPGLNVAGIRFDEADLRFVRGDGGITLERLVLRSGADTLVAEGAVSASGDALDLRAEATIGDVADLLTIAPEPWRARGRLDARAEITGSLDEPVAALEVRTGRLLVAGQQIDAGAARVELRRQGFRVDNVELTQNDGGRLVARGEGSWADPTAALAAIFERFAIAPVPATGGAGELVPLRGLVDGDLELRYTDGYPAIDGTLIIDEARLAEALVGRVNIELAAGEDRQRIGATIPSLGARLDTSIDRSAPADLVVELQADDTDLERLAALLPSDLAMPLRGALSARLEIAGSAGDPGSWTGFLDLQQLAAEVGSTRIGLPRPGRLDYRADRASADVALDVGAARLDISGALTGATGEVVATLTGDVADLDDLVALAGEIGATIGEASPAGGNVPAFVGSGPFRLVARLGGVSSDPTVTAELTLDRATLGLEETPPLVDASTRISLADGLVRIERLEGRWLDSPVTASGTLPVAVITGNNEAGERAAFDLRIENLTLAAAAAAFDPSLAERGEARVTARVSLETDALRLAAVRGDLILEDAAIAAAGVGLEQERPTRLRLEGGELSIVDLSWVGAAGRVAARGSVVLDPEPAYEVTVDGDLDLRTLRLVLPAGVTTTGRVNGTALAGGAGALPTLSGTLQLTDAELRVQQPRLAVTEVNGVVRLATDRIVVERIDGSANGGRVSLTGELDYDATGVSGGELRLTGRDVALEAIDGLRTLVDLDVAFRPEPEPATLAGELTIVRGEYRRRLSLTSELLEALSRGELPGGGGETLGDLRLDLRIVTEEDLQVDNNLARLQLSADLRLSGSPASPVLSGRAEIGEGGQVFLGGNTYRVETGSIDFVDPTGIAPELTLTAVTVVSNYEITLDASGPPDALEVELASDPALDRSDLVSVLVTGRTLNQAGSMQTQVAQEQVAGFLAGELSARAGNAIGLDSVRLERGLGEENADFDPVLVASETDPSMRLTLSKRVGPDLELTFSQNLREAGGFTWIVGYRVLRNLELRAVSRDDNDRSYEFSHDLRFGGGVARDADRAAAAARVGLVTIAGELGEPEREIRARLRLESGDRFDIFRWQDDRDRLERWYHDRGYYEARVRSRTEERTEGASVTVDLSYDIRRGPATRLVIEGHSLSGNALGRMREAWRRSVIDEFLVEELDRIAREALAADGFVAPRVDVDLLDDPDTAVKTARLTLAPGQRTADRRIEFIGNERVTSAALRTFVARQEAGRGAWVDPAPIGATVEEFYRQAGFLGVTVEVGAAAVVDDAFVLPVTIEEGPLYRITALHIEGAESRTPAVLAAETGLALGSVYAPGSLRRGQRAVETGYRARGFASVEVTTSAELDADGGVEATFSIREGRRQVIERIDISGANRTRLAFVRDRLGVEPGMPVDLAGLYQARRRLYRTGVFRRIDIRVENLEESTAPETALVASDDESAAPHQPVAIVVALEERPRFRFRYGVGVNDERALLSDMVGRDFDLGASSDFVDRNLFGRAMTAGLSLRYDRDKQVGRTYFSTPYFLGLPLTSTAFLSRSRETFRGEAIIPLIADRSTLALEQRFRLYDLLDVSYSYSFERNHTFEEDFDPDNPFAFDITVDIARFTVGGIIDRRDDAFDATRGWSHSSSLENSLPALGSDLRFLRFLTQQTYFKPLGRGVVLASAARLGLATAFEQELLPSERFYAGGGNSVRGYPEDSLGPVDFFGSPLGGNALLVLKQEVRFPLRWIFRGVAFLDAGNVFERVGDLSVTDLKTSWGLGLRVDTPLVLLRFDYGFRIGRGPDEPIGRFFFSIGQAF